MLLGRPPAATKSSPTHVLAIIGGVCGLVVMLLVTVPLAFFWRRKKQINEYILTKEGDFEVSSIVI